MEDLTVRNAQIAKERALAAHHRQMENERAVAVQRRRERIMTMQTTFMDTVQKELLNVAVIHAIRAALSDDGDVIKPLLDKLKKVELKTTPDPSNFTLRVSLLLWWDVGEGEFHVSTRETVLEEGMRVEPAEVLEELTTFEAEELLKYAAFL